MDKKDCVNNNNIFFTVIPTKVSGFTDQMTQFIALYLLGVNHDFKYFHTDLKSNRSTYPPLNNDTSLYSNVCKKIQIAIRTVQRKISFPGKHDIFNYLGFNEYFRGKSSCLNYKTAEKIKIDFSNEVLDRNNINSVSDLNSYIESFVKGISSNDLLFVFYISKGRRVINLVFSDIDINKIGVELRGKYLKLKRKNNRFSRFDKNVLKILVHIRQGDTSLIKTPWDTWIPVYALYDYIEGTFGELKDVSELKTHFYIAVCDYYKFIEKVFLQSKENDSSLLVFSDGFKRGFSKIYRNIHMLNISDLKRELLMESEKHYDKKAFQMFNDLSSTKLIIGEDKNKLLELVNSVFDSDIIVIGNHQAMIPKLLSVYFDESNMPLVIVLYRVKIPNLQFLQEEVIKRKFIFFNVVSDSYDQVLTEINSKISGSSV